MKEIEQEISIASLRYGAFHSTHEGYGVLAEEMAELLDAIRANDPEGIRRECFQVAAVAARLADAVDHAMAEFETAAFAARSGWRR